MILLSRSTSFRRRAITSRSRAPVNTATATIGKSGDPLKRLQVACVARVALNDPHGSLLLEQPLSRRASAKPAMLKVHPPLPHPRPAQGIPPHPPLTVSSPAAIAPRRSRPRAALELGRTAAD